MRTPFELVIAGGRVALPGGIHAAPPLNIGIRGGKIAAVTLDPIDGEETIDAAGNWIIPGLVDEHFHVFCGYGCETWANATTAAAKGGVTTVAKMPLDKPATVSGNELAQSIARAGEEAVVDHVFWGGVDPTNFGGLAEQAALGVAGYKLFIEGAAPPGMYPTCNAAQMLDAFKRIAALKSTAIVHAENGLIADLCTEQLRSQGVTRPDAWSDARPPIAELEGIARTILLAEAVNCRTIVAHVSVPRALEMIAEARASGVRISAETCPQYLLLSRDHLRKDKRLKWNPPCRTREEVEGMWELLRKGLIGAIASDHGPLPKDESADIWDISAGVGNMAEIMLSLMLSEGIFKREIGISLLVEKMSAQPARNLGLYPRKGAICVGADADLVIVDMDQAKAIRGTDLCYTAGHWSAFDGWDVHAVPITTILRGKIVAQDGDLVAEPGYGMKVDRVGQEDGGLAGF
ncbi:amidohydrolase family protein [Candidatus Bipolaricaulota bacterium]|nr:amidohydrolase family protein [Candidatus Bipolaricaulota bacterium]